MNELSEPTVHVFISYSRRDARLADRVAAALTAAGFAVWIDRAGIRGGELWREQIVAAIGRSRWFVLLVSPHSMQSDDVRRELDLAVEAGCPVVPVTIAAAEIPDPLRYQLAGVHLIDLKADFAGGMREVLSAVGAEPTPPARQPRALLQSLLAGAGAVALCAASLPVLRGSGLVDDEPGIVAGLATTLPSWSLFAGLPTLALAAVAAIAWLVFRRRSPGTAATLLDRQPVGTAIALYLLLAVPGTLLLGQAAGAALALVTAGGAWIVHFRAGRRLLSRLAVLSLALLPALPIFGEVLWRSSRSDVTGAAKLLVPNPHFRSPESAGFMPAALAPEADPALRDLSARMRETFKNVFSDVRVVLSNDDDALRPLLHLENIVKMHEGCADAGDDRLYAFLLRPLLKRTDGTEDRSIPEIGFNACSRDVELATLKAANVLLARLQDRDPPEFSRDEVMQLRRLIVLGWYVALKKLAIRVKYDEIDWFTQDGILDESVEKARIAEIFPAVYASDEFAKVDFIWRNTKPEFSDEDVKRILSAFPSTADSEADPHARDAVNTHLGSLTGLGI